MNCKWYLIRKFSGVHAKFQIDGYSEQILAAETTEIVITTKSLYAPKSKFWMAL